MAQTNQSPAPSLNEDALTAVKAVSPEASRNLDVIRRDLQAQQDIATTNKSPNAEAAAHVGALVKNEFGRELVAADAMVRDALNSAPGDTNAIAALKQFAGGGAAGDKLANDVAAAQAALADPSASNDARKQAVDRVGGDIIGRINADVAASAKTIQASGGQAKPEASPSQPLPNTTPATSLSDDVLATVSAVSPEAARNLDAIRGDLQADRDLSTTNKSPNIQALAHADTQANMNNEFGRKLVAADAMVRDALNSAPGDANVIAALKQFAGGGTAGDKLADDVAAAQAALADQSKSAAEKKKAVDKVGGDIIGRINADVAAAAKTIQATGGQTQLEDPKSQTLPKGPSPISKAMHTPS